MVFQRLCGFISLRHKRTLLTPKHDQSSSGEVRWSIGNLTPDSLGWLTADMIHWVTLDLCAHVCADLIPTHGTYGGKLSNCLHVLSPASFFFFSLNQLEKWENHLVISYKVQLCYGLEPFSTGKSHQKKTDSINIRLTFIDRDFCSMRPPLGRLPVRLGAAIDRGVKTALKPVAPLSPRRASPVWKPLYVSLFKLISLHSHYCW